MEKTCRSASLWPSYGEGKYGGMIAPRWEKGDPIVKFKPEVPWESIASWGLEASECAHEAMDTLGSHGVLAASEGAHKAMDPLRSLGWLEASEGAQEAMDPLGSHGGLEASEGAHEAMDPLGGHGWLEAS